jgi:hypothetical protein
MAPYTRDGGVRTGLKKSFDDGIEVRGTRRQ